MARLHVDIPKSAVDSLASSLLDEDQEQSYNVRVTLILLGAATADFASKLLP